MGKTNTIRCVSLPGNGKKLTTGTYRGNDDQYSYYILYNTYF